MMPGLGKSPYSIPDPAAAPHSQKEGQPTSATKAKSSDTGEALH